jgi:hypothetical protein
MAEKGKPLPALMIRLDAWLAPLVRPNVVDVPGCPEYAAKGELALNRAALLPLKPAYQLPAL